ncbi:hypothetical protein BCR43DRAFT_502960 [Syncephalastrum racemosum]|uniref:Uncharacterized protein n=1 Tax=Syncephalastrum racemosum TaxID=13706 RepID=A0A1X2HQ30_SYNRA|nr:hypothetical protein BCR43DRAFT_502960 [Syncephalastrum racemosum]
MIVNCFEAGHHEAALDLVEAIVVSGRRPTEVVILSLFDLILRPHDVNKRWDMKTMFQAVQKAQRLLFCILETFGVKAFDCIWPLFRAADFDVSYRRKRTRQMLQEAHNGSSDEEEPYECSLTEFDNLWHLIGLCFGRRKPDPTAASLQTAGAKRRWLMVVSVLISILEQDMRERRGNNKQQGKCRLLMTIRKDLSGTRSQLDTYLDIIFAPFQFPEEGEDASLRPLCVELSGRILNMLILLSYCENYIDATALVEQSYRQFSRLDADGCTELLSMLRFPSYVSALCDMDISNSNLQDVDESWKHLRSTRMCFRVDKLLYFNTKTRPNAMRSLESIYRHATVVVMRWMSFVDERSMRYETKQGGLPQRHVTGLEENVKLQIVLHGSDSAEQWRVHIEKLMDEVILDHPGEKTNEELRDKIRKLVELNTINMTLL